MKTSKPFFRPWPIVRSSSEPASSALKSVDTSSKLLRAIARDWPSYSRYVPKMPSQPIVITGTRPTSSHVGPITAGGPICSAST